MTITAETSKAAHSPDLPDLGKKRFPIKALRPLARSFSTVLFVVAAASFLFLAVGPRFFGYQTSTMLTGSMAPLINPGDVIVSARVPVSELKVGDIVTYSIPVEDHRVETHRIIEIRSTPGGPSTIRTKGDANNGPDPWAATLTEATIDRHVLTVPYLGAGIRVLREPVVLTSLMYGAPALLVGMLLVTIWRRPSRRESQGSPADHA